MSACDHCVLCAAAAARFCMFCIIKRNRHLQREQPPLDQRTWLRTSHKWVAMYCALHLLCLCMALVLLMLL
jgi:hypothetical protein